MLVRQLTIEDKDQLYELINSIENSLKNKDFWLPISDASRENFFDNERTYFLGDFVWDKLVSAVALHFGENENTKLLGLPSSKVAELGCAMTLPKYRSMFIMEDLCGSIINHARDIGLSHLIATVHPNNVAGQAVLAKLGFKKQTNDLKHNKDILSLVL